MSTLVSVFLHVKGRVDMDAEITKAQKKLDKANAAIQKQEKIFNDPNYEAKVSAEVKEMEQKKLADSKQEINSFEETIRQFEQLKLE